MSHEVLKYAYMTAIGVLTTPVTNIKTDLEIQHQDENALSKRNRKSYFHSVGYHLAKTLLSEYLNNAITFSDTYKQMIILLFTYPFVVWQRREHRNLHYESMKAEKPLEKHLFKGFIPHFIYNIIPTLAVDYWKNYHQNQQSPGGDVVAATTAAAAVGDGGGADQSSKGLSRGVDHEVIGGNFTGLFIKEEFFLRLLVKVFLIPFEVISQRMSTSHCISGLDIFKDAVKNEGIFSLYFFPAIMTVLEVFLESGSIYDYLVFLRRSLKTKAK